jgi:hypothetical protein
MGRAVAAESVRGILPDFSLDEPGHEVRVNQVMSPSKYVFFMVFKENDG